MRPIKFRGKTLGNNQWVYGSLIIPSDHQSEYIIENEGSWYVEPDTIGQFTGLLDCNGKEIYEGDVLKAAEPWFYVVIWKDEFASFVAQKRYFDNEIYGCRSLDDLSILEIIGNIHDNIFGNSKLLGYD
jgi:uncharacterized phage protein (TIGR01671 family)